MFPPAVPSLGAGRLTVGNRTYLVADSLMEQRLGLIRQLSATDLPVLIVGETGVGKEHAAYAVHHWSRRSLGPFLVLNCAALQDTLVESELFGYQKGAFTGAHEGKRGFLEVADSGTIFLDEIAELSPNAQSKILRFAESGTFVRLGDVRERKVDVRIVAASNRSLEQEVKAGRFRQDLFFRLSPATVVVPPLRDRPRDIPVLARHFLAEALRAQGRPTLAIEKGVDAVLLAHVWPGNVRELRNLMLYLAATVQEPPITIETVRACLRRQSSALSTLLAPAELTPRVFRSLSEEIQELEQRRIAEALEAAGGVQTEAARLIGVPLRTFANKVRKYGLRRQSAVGLRRVLTRRSRGTS